MEAWQTVFFIAISMYLTTTTIFIIFGSAEVQPWNSPPTHSSSSKYSKDRVGKRSGFPAAKLFGKKSFMRKDRTF